MAGREETVEVVSGGSESVVSVELIAAVVAELVV